MIAPCVAILSDRVPQKYRGSMSAFYGAGQIVGQSMGTIIGSAFIDAPKTGFMIDTICWCLCGIGTVLLLPRELSAATADARDSTPGRSPCSSARRPRARAISIWRSSDV